MSKQIKNTNIVHTLIHKLVNNEYFLFARYTDGECVSICNWDCFSNIAATHSLGNCDGHRYPQILNDCLKNAISCPENIVYSNENKYIFQSKINSFIEHYTKNPKINIECFKKIDFKVKTYVKDFTDLVVSEDKESNELFKNFINQINKKYIVFIGPDYIIKSKFLNIKKHITIPKNNCFSEIDRIQSEINELLDDNPKCFLFSAGLSTNFLIEKLKSKAIDKHFMIDVGSVFDNFLSKNQVPEIYRRFYCPSNMKERFPEYWLE